MLQSWAYPPRDAARAADDCIRSVHALPQPFQPVYSSSFRCEKQAGRRKAQPLQVSTACRDIPLVMHQMHSSSFALTTQNVKSSSVLRYFNAVQSECFPVVYGTDANMVRSSETPDGRLLSILTEFLLVRKFWPESSACPCFRLWPHQQALARLSSWSWPSSTCSHNALISMDSTNTGESFSELSTWHQTRHLYRYVTLSAPVHAV